jgi:hypothetical protein
MNKNQKRILIGMIVIIVSMLLYPPFQGRGSVSNDGYGWIFYPKYKTTVNSVLLLIQWLGVLIVGGIALLLAKSVEQKPQSSIVKNEGPISTQPTQIPDDDLKKNTQQQ